MKGNDQVLMVLNGLLADELTAINQYIVHAEMCENWGYERLERAIQSRAIQEMKHAQALIARTLFLEGTPVVSSLNAIHIGAAVEAQHRNDWTAEYNAIESYNMGIAVAAEVGDDGTRALLESIVLDEEAHIHWIETQIAQIAHVGLQNYLGEQIE
jgi:bacterioferritin